ncbi:uncharacterized protein N7477_000412 [Penicillium maclennaniae]|uniref:uncharacterized protein n=1 Tax=Penicillium maclennaniae TaxID=1343394 RepID=UPI00253FF730|nr:uncharacterized protein N7477_000412 [Penicillium maclennaniae]KAJ5684067.1 hypothetical protein N7477_000412 [Penicillium maclennaniae]
MNPGHHSSSDDCSDLSSDSDNVSSHQHRPQQSKDRSEALARHIAVHLQVLMLLTLRFAALHKDDGVLDDGIKSDSVDIDDGNSASKANDLGRLSDIDSQADVSMKDTDGQDKGGDAMDLDDYVDEDDIPIPDTDLDLEDVPRQCDGLAAENDDFLKKVIESGAYQSWRDAHEEPARGGPSLSHEDYTIAWICALPVETAAAKLMLDEIHPSLPRLAMDQNTYIFGSIGEHNIVIASLPTGAYGNTSAAMAGMQLLSSFHAIRFGFSIGIGGGVPSSNADIRLGDIVVSQPTGTSGGVIQCDLGKALSGGQFKPTGMLNAPPRVLLTALNTLRAQHLTADSRFVGFVSNLQAKIAPHKAAKFTRPIQEDYLFQAEYDHIASDMCEDCDRSKLVPRSPREHQEPVIHYGLIGSINQVVKDGRQRDQLARDLGIYCVDMEVAGLMNNYPCLVIRGICDYADSHKNKKWQGYAAAVAAAYAKELLLVVAIDQVNSTPTLRDTLANSDHRFDVPLDLTTVPVIESFLGRQDELEKLWQHLHPTNVQSRKVAIVHGLGGIGKTQIAIRFARNHKHDFTAIFWLSGKDRGTLLQSLSSIFLRLLEQSQITEPRNDEDVEQRAKHVLWWLAMAGNSRWLIIFDDVNQYSAVNGAPNAYNIGEFFPAADHGSILITSRLRGLTELGKSFLVNKLDNDDAIRLLSQSSSFSPNNTIRGSKSNPDTLALASHLDGFPLAITIAGAFMRETGTSIAEYLQYYQESWPDLQLQSNPGRHYQQGNMLQTWMISYREIRKRDPNAAELLLFLARFDHQDIWYGLIQSSRHSSNVPVWLERTISSWLTFTTSIKKLVDFSLLETKKEWGSYTMHPVVQDWCIQLSSIDKSVDSTRLNELALISVGYTVPSSGERNSSRLQERLIPHANHVRLRDWSSGNIDIAVWKAFDGLGCLYSDQGKLKTAEEMYQRAFAGKEKALGPDHMSTLDTVNNLGLLYFNQGKLKEAEEMYQRALVGYEKALGPDHTSTLDTVNNLGFLYFNQGKPKEAEEMYQRALAGKEKALGPDHTSTLDTVNNLGFLYFNQGKPKEAEEIYERALVGYEKALGPDHMSTLTIVNNLSLLYFNQGKLKEAEEMYQRALVGYEKALGPDHMSTLTIVNNLSLLYFNQGKLKEAEEMYERALVGYEKALGYDHSTTQQVMERLNAIRMAN